MGFGLLGLGIGHWEREINPQKWELNRIEIMRVDSQFFRVLSILKYNFDPFLVSLVLIFVVNYIIHSTTCEQAYLAPGILGFLIMCVPKSDAQRNICLVFSIYFI